MTDDEKLAKIMGQRFLLLRTKADVSQVDCAKQLGCNQSLVSDWQCGRRIITTRYLWKICRFFGVPFDYFDPANQDYLVYLEPINKLVMVES